MASVDFKVFSDPGQGQGRPGRGAARPGRRRDDRAARSTPTPSSSRSTAPRAWPGSRSTTSAKGREGLQSPVVKNLHDAGARRGAQAHRRQGRRPDLLRRRQGVHRQRRARRAARQGRAQRLRQGARPGAGRVGAALGGGLPDVRVRRGRADAGTRCTTPSPRPRTATRTGSRPIPAAASPRPTTWC